MSTNLILKQIKDVEIAGESFIDRNKYKSQKEIIENVFMPAFKGLKENITSFIPVYVNLDKLIEGTSFDFNPLLEKLEELKKCVSESTYDKTVTKIIHEINYELKDMKKSLEDKWKDYVNIKTGAIAEILKVLEKLICETTEYHKLLNERYTFNNSEAGSERALKAIEEYNKIYENLMEKMNLKENVLEFLKLLASNQKVTFSDIDSDVFEWIKTSEFADKINLKIN